MSEFTKEKTSAPDVQKVTPPRVRGIGNPESHSQDADRHHKIKHPKSDK